jgi:quinol monooxygenase YgiN
MELITTDFQQSIKIGELETFKKTVNSMIEVTARNEPDTLGYNWFINEEGTECHLLETFKDSEAFITHLHNVGPMFPKLLESCTVTRAKIFGEPSDTLKELLVPFGVEYFSHFNGISR